MEQLELFEIEAPAEKHVEGSAQVADIELRLKFNKKKKELKAFINRDRKFKQYLVYELRGMLKNTLKIYRSYNLDGSLVQDDVDILSYRALNTIMDPCYLNEENYKY